MENEHVLVLAFNKGTLRTFKLIFENTKLNLSKIFTPNRF